MQPFPVLCETCGAKLKVRDPAAIGQIHACPKCESMVHIIAPVAAADQNPTAIAPISASPSRMESAKAPADFATEIDQLLQTPAQAPESQSTELSHGESEPLDPDSETLESATSSNAVATLVWSGAGVLACFVVGGLVAAWWMNSDNDSNATTTVASLAIPMADATGDSTDADSTEQASETSAMEVNKPVVDPSEQLPESQSNTSSAAADTEPTLEPILPDLPPAKDANEQPSVADEPIESNEPDTLPPLDPLAIDSANLDLLLIPDADLGGTPKPVETLSDSVEAEVPEETIDIAPAAPSRFTAGSSSRGPTFDESFSEEELEQRLATVVPSAAWRNVPAYMAFEELAQLSGTPITVDPATLRMRGLSAQQSITLVSEGESILSLSQSMAQQLKLATEPVTGGLLLVKPGVDRWRDQQYDVSDLARGTEQTQILADAVRNLVAPDTWGSADASLEIGDGLLKVNQQMRVHYDLLILCERWRIARGLPSRSRYPVTLLDNKPRLAQLSGKLARPTTFSFVDWTPLSQALGYLQESSNLVLLADWHTMGQIDLRPATTISASANNMPWSDALDATLAPIGLAWLPVDGQTLQITTQEAAEQRDWVEFYPTNNPQALRSRIESRADTTSLASMYCHEDMIGGLLIVRGNRTVHTAALTE